MEILHITYLVIPSTQTKEKNYCNDDIRSDTLYQHLIINYYIGKSINGHYLDVAYTEISKNLIIIMKFYY